MAERQLPKLHTRVRFPSPAPPEYEPKAHAPGIGTLDFCFIASVPLEQVIASLEKHKVPIIEGPCTKTGAMGAIRSVYFRDPDLNLVEVSEYI